MGLENSGGFPPPLCAVKEKGQNMLKSVGKELILRCMLVYVSVGSVV